MKQLLLFLLVVTGVSCTKDEAITKQTTAVPDEICIRCEVIQGVISGGDVDLLPEMEDFCGTTARVDSFEANYWQRYQVWVNSWQWQGSGNSSVNCDRY